MAALIKELLLDAALNKLHVDMHSDLVLAIQSAYVSKVLSAQDIKILDLYLSGYTANEISVQEIKITEEIETILERIFRIVEEHANITDKKFLDSLYKTQRYRKSGLQKLELFMSEHGKVFNTHSLEGE